MHLLLIFISADRFWKNWSLIRCCRMTLKWFVLNGRRWCSQPPTKPQPSNTFLTVVTHGEKKVSFLYIFKSIWNSRLDILGFSSTCFILAQNMTILLCVINERGVAPSSPYTILVHVDLFTPNTSLQNLRCNFSKMSVPSWAQTSHPYSKTGFTSTSNSSNWMYIGYCCCLILRSKENIALLPFSYNSFSATVIFPLKLKFKPRYL